MTTFLNSRPAFAGVVLCLAALLNGCATPTGVSRDTVFQPNEGMLALRLVDLGDTPLQRLTVVSESTGQEYPLDFVRFGQTSTMTVVGRLPAGRYQPANLFGAKPGGARYSGGSVQVITDTITAPITALTGKFDVEAARVTDLGTMIFVTAAENNFYLPLDPTPVPTEKLVPARFPALANAIGGKSSLGWVKGTVPTPPKELLAFGRSRVNAITNPVHTEGGQMLAGGPFGVIAQHRPGQKPRNVSTNSLHAIESVLVLKDGRWLAGGEEGFVAISGDAGLKWQRLPGLNPEEVVLHLSQAANGKIYMVTDLDREALVYETAPNPIEWKVIRRIPSDREQGIWTRSLTGPPNYLRDWAASSRERLVVYTRSDSLTTLDLRTGQWDVQTTPRSFNSGMKVTPDGYVVGIFSQGWVYGSLDYGKTWNRLDVWVNMTMPHFIDRNRGYVVAADMSYIGNFKYQLRTTDDGGKTWKAGEVLAGGWNPLQPLWTDPAGSTLYTVEYGRIFKSEDQGKTWK